MKRKNKLGVKREVVHVLTTETMLGVAGGVTTQPPPSVKPQHCTHTNHGGGCQD